MPHSFFTDLPIETWTNSILPLFSGEEFFRVFFLSMCVCKKGLLPNLPASFVVGMIKSTFPSVNNWPAVPEVDFFVGLARRYFTRPPYYSMATTGYIVSSFLRGSWLRPGLHVAIDIAYFRIILGRGASNILMTSWAGRRRLLLALEHVLQDAYVVSLEEGPNSLAATIVRMYRDEIRDAYALVRVDGVPTIAGYDGL
jgi:hypothetical protein